jgi:glycosyltransferase involved in cell wall biosynthesis
MIKKRILYLQSTSEIGGSDVSLLRLIANLDRNLFEPYVILPNDGPLAEELRKHSCEIYFMKEMLKLTTRKGKIFYFKYSWNYLFTVRKIVRCINDWNIDLVHTNTVHNLYGFLAAKVSGRPHIWHVREIVFQSRFLWWIEKFLLRRFSDFIIVTSDAVAEMFGENRNTFPIRKIANGVDLELYHPMNSGCFILDPLDIPSGVPIIGMVARLDRWKGVEIFLKAISICKKKHPEVQYVIVGGEIEGSSEYAKELYQLAEELQLNEVVHFTGWRYGPEDMPDVYAAMDLLVHASTSPEPFGLVILEAMATAKPVVATNQGGPKEICIHNETALLVPPGDPEKLAEAISYLIQNPQLAREMGKAGRKRVEKIYGQRQCVESIEALYKELLSMEEPCVELQL